MATDMREVKRLARQGLPHPDPAVRAAVVARQRRWYRLAWLPTVLGCLGILAVPILSALAWTTRNWAWMVAAPPTVLIAALLLAAAFGVWVTGLRSGWLVAPNLPDAPPAPLPLRVPTSLPRSPVVPVFLTVVLMALEWIVIAITVESARMAALAMLPSTAIGFVPALIALISQRAFGPQVIIEAEGVRLPSIRVALAWEQVAAIRSYDRQAAGLAILPAVPVRLPWWWRMSPYQSPWLLIPDVMMTTAVETVVSTAIHARNARLQLVGEVDRAS